MYRGTAVPLSLPHGSTFRVRPCLETNEQKSEKVANYLRAWIKYMLLVVLYSPWEGGRRKGLERSSFVFWETIGMRMVCRGSSGHPTKESELWKVGPEGGRQAMGLNRVLRLLSLWGTITLVTRIHSNTHLVTSPQFSCGEPGPPDTQRLGFQ